MSLAQQSALYEQRERDRLAREAEVRGLRAEANRLRARLAIAERCATRLVQREAAALARVHRLELDAIAPRVDVDVDVVPAPCATYDHTAGSGAA